MAGHRSVNDFQQPFGELDVSILVVLELLDLLADPFIAGFGEVGVNLRSLALLLKQCEELFAQHRLFKHQRPLLSPCLPTARPIADVCLNRS